MKQIFYLSTFLVGVMLASCKTAQPLQYSYREINLPVVSIDSIFDSRKIYKGQFHAKRLTLAVSKLLDSVSMDSAFRYVPNYILDKKIRSTYSISAKLGPVKLDESQKAVGSFTGFTTDNETGNKSDAFGCFGNNSTDWRCFSFNKTMLDSTDYENLKSTLYLGLPEVRYLVPMHKLLRPINLEKNLISFSLERAIQTANDDDLEQANILTYILNNIFVFNQSTVKRKVFENFTSYNYYENYIKSGEKKKKANFKLTAILKTTPAGDYQLEFFPKGKNINLVAPEKLSTIITFSKQRLKKKEYSEAMFQITRFVKEFVLMNTLFEQK